MYENKTTEGITEDYVWYQARLLSNKMNDWSVDFDRLISVMEARHKEHLKIISSLLDEIQALKRGQKKYWVDLTAEEIGEIYRAGWSNNMDFARVIQAKLKELNETPV